ncbi:unnamed protein product, partial [Amoebophrya sp. A25]
FDHVKASAGHGANVVPLVNLNRIVARPSLQFSPGKLLVGPPGGYASPSALLSGGPPTYRRNEQVQQQREQATSSRRERSAHTTVDTRGRGKTDLVQNSSTNAVLDKVAHSSSERTTSTKGKVDGDHPPSIVDGGPSILVRPRPAPAPGILDMARTRGRAPNFDPATLRGVSPRLFVQPLVPPVSSKPLCTRQPMLQSPTAAKVSASSDK